MLLFLTQSSRCVHPLQSSSAQAASGHLTDLTFVADSTSQRFHFDHIFPESCDQKKIFEDSVGPLIPLLFDGYNICVLVYGQSGAGKTFTLAGPPTEAHLVNHTKILIYHNWHNHNILNHSEILIYHNWHNHNILNHSEILIYRNSKRHNIRKDYII